MEVIQLTSTPRLHGYACSAIQVHPNPPRVGVATKLALAFKNPGPEAITIQRVQFKVAAFGIGLAWEHLPAVAGITLPANPDHIEEVAVQWIPPQEGHRCVHVTIDAAILSRPLTLGRNMEVIAATADERTWHVPFRLGNPKNARMPVVLKAGTAKDDGVDMLIMHNGHLLDTGQPVWLHAKEERAVDLFLYARTTEAIKAVKTVEAYIGGHFIDGIQVEIARPAFINNRVSQEPARSTRLEIEETAPSGLLLASQSYR